MSHVPCHVIPVGIKLFIETTQQGPGRDTKPRGKCSMTNSDTATQSLHVYVTAVKILLTAEYNMQSYVHISFRI